jgi:hypothetical protein
MAVVDPGAAPVRPIEAYVDLPPSLQGLGESSKKKEKEKKVSVQCCIVSWLMTRSLISKR